MVMLMKELYHFIWETRWGKYLRICCGVILIPLLIASMIIPAMHPYQYWLTTLCWSAVLVHEIIRPVEEKPSAQRMHIVLIILGMFLVVSNILNAVNAKPF
ncbi:hypothetical protein [Atopobium fossor]|uniref:hypothetical protein n=1 Tax=Atopobium fossor TaxID=39487 RepID=UPI000482C658|nr:hypothetical protein [Atopobium fossor]